MEMTLFNLNDNKLTLECGKFELLEKPIRGGFSWVYKARQKDGLFPAEYLMIKEFHPHKLVSGRGSCGKVKWLSSKDDVNNLVEKRVELESKIATKLRNANGGNNPRFFPHSEPVKANNTYYTIIATEDGKMLSDMIDDPEYLNNIDFSDVCDIIEKLLITLKHIHDAGYLHLDVSPDNIHLSANGVVRLIDFNSAYPIGSDVKKLKFFKKDGYSAHELVTLDTSKNHELCYATDIFSVVAIFFELVKKRVLKNSDVSTPSMWYIHRNKDAIFNNSSSFFISKVNEFIEKGIHISPHKRFENTDKMLDAIKKLKNLNNKVLLNEKYKKPTHNFVCRSNDVQEIRAKLQQDNHVFLYGMGGIGKSELSKKYAQEFRGDYKVIQFIKYNESTKNTIVNNLGFTNADETISYIKQCHNTNEASERIFEEKLNWLKQHLNDEYKALIIIDNYLKEEEVGSLTELISVGCHIIFTTREENPNRASLKIEPMTSKGELLTLFNQYYGKNKSNLDETIVYEMMKLVDNHTMTIMLIALLMKAQNLTAAEMYEKLKKGINTDISTKLDIYDKEGVASSLKEQPMYGHIRTLFDMTDIKNNEAYRYIMTNMAIAPANGIKKRTLHNWIYDGFSKQEKNTGDLTNINWLIQNGWIQEEIDEKDDSVISLHAVISDVANYELKPNTDSVKCGVLVKSLIDYAKSFYDEPPVKLHIIVDALRVACDRIGDVSELCIKLLRAAGYCASEYGDYHAASAYHKKAVDIGEHVSYVNPEDIAIEYYNLATDHGNNGKNDLAIKYYNLAYEVRKDKLEITHKETMITCLSLAKAHYTCIEYQKAFYFYNILLTECDDDLSVADRLEIYLDMHMLFRRLAASLYDFTTMERSTEYHLLSSNENDIDWLGKAVDICNALMSNALSYDFRRSGYLYTAYHLLSSNNKMDIDWLLGMQLNICNLSISMSEAISYDESSINTYLAIAKTYERQADIYFNNLNRFNENSEEYMIFETARLDRIDALTIALSIATRVNGEKHSTTADIAVMLVNAMINGNNKSDLLINLTAYVKEVEEMFGENHPRTADAYEWVGSVSKTTASRAFVTEEDVILIKSAIQWYEKALPVYKSVYGENSGKTVSLLIKIVDCYCYIKDHDKSIELLNSLLHIDPNLTNGNEPYLFLVYKRLADVYFFRKRDIFKAKLWYEKVFDKFPYVRPNDSYDIRTRISKINDYIDIQEKIDAKKKWLNDVVSANNKCSEDIDLECLRIARFMKIQTYKFTHMRHSAQNYDEAISYYKQAAKMYESIKLNEPESFLSNHYLQEANASVAGLYTSIAMLVYHNDPAKEDEYLLIASEWDKKNQQ